MSTVADKLTYLNVTKQKLKDVINATGGNLTNESTFRSYPNILNQKILAAINGEIDLWNEYPKVTGEASNLTLNTEEAKLSIIPEGNSSQESTEGKNLFVTPEGGTVNGITFKKNANGTYDISGTSTSTRADIYVETDLTNFVNGETYTMSANKELDKVRAFFEIYNGSTWIRHALGGNSVITSANPVITGNFNSTGGDRVRFTIRILPNTTVDIKGIGIQLEKGSSATTFEKYTNGVSPNLDFPQSIKVVTGEQNVTISKNGNTLSQNYSLSLGNSILSKLVEDKDYIFKNEINSIYYNDELEINSWYVCYKNDFYEGGWRKGGNQQFTDTTIFYTTKKDSKKSNYTPLCTHLSYNNNNYYYNVVSISEYKDTQEIGIRLPNTIADTVEKLNSWISDNNVKILYSLENPIYEKIVDTTLISQLEYLNNNAKTYSGTTVVECTSSNNESLIVNVTGLKKLNILEVNNEI